MRHSTPRGPSTGSAAACRGGARVVDAAAKASKDKERTSLVARPKVPSSMPAAACTDDTPSTGSTPRPARLAANRGESGGAPGACNWTRRSLVVSSNGSAPSSSSRRAHHQRRSQHPIRRRCHCRRHHQRSIAHQEPGRCQHCKHQAQHCHHSIPSHRNRFAGTGGAARTQRTRRGTPRCAPPPPDASLLAARSTKHTLRFRQKDVHNDSLVSNNADTTLASSSSVGHYYFTNYRWIGIRARPVSRTRLPRRERPSPPHTQRTQR